ncbi:MAG: ACP S-malonyltransferase [Venatoribacter sp.]
MTDVIAFFPGQGAQHVGMLADLSEQYPVIKETFAQASDVLGFDLWAMVQDGPEATLSLTYNTQPALLAASVALWRVINAQTGNLNVVAAAGHSLGEYSALVAANALSFSDAVQLVRTRGELMDAALPAGQGGMAAILGLEEEQIREVCTQASKVAVVEPANFNAPGQIVIAGAADGIVNAIELAKEAGAKRALPLSVSGPFHSSLMKAAADKFAKALDAVVFNEPKFAVYQNVNNQITSLEQIKANLLAQLYSPVNWIGAVEATRSSADLAIEFGPGKVLAGLNKRIDKTLETITTGDLSALQSTLSRL